MTFRIATSARLFWLLLFGLLALKTGLNLSITQYDIDGGYYAEVAGHVQAGEGLVTRVSLYHKGYEDFPHPTVIYPLWPQLLGHVARLAPMGYSAVWVPTLLYAISLLFGYLWANRAFPGPVIEGFPALRAGHLFTLLLGVNLSFFYITSVPYTEGLAFALLLGFFLRASTLLETPGVLPGMEIGIWLGLLFLTRSQWAIVVLATGLTLVWAFFRNDRKLAHSKMVGAAATTFSAIFFLYWAEASKILVDDSIWNYLRFGKARPNDLLFLPDPQTNQADFLSWVIERLRGVLVAFNPLNPKSYVLSFFFFIYAIPAALVVGLTAFWRDRAHASRLFKRALRFLVRPQGYSWLLMVGLFTLLSLLLVHTLKSGHTEWYFPRRHAIPVVFAVFFSFLFLLRTPISWARRLGVLILVLGTFTSLGGIWLRWEGVRTPDPMEAERARLIDWLHATRGQKGDLTVAINGHEAQRLAWRTQRINYHWVGPQTRLEQLRVMHEALGAEYLILKSPPGSTSQQRPSHFRENESAFVASYREIKAPTEGFRIYVWRDGPDNDGRLSR